MGPGGAAPRGAGIGRAALDAGQRARVYSGSESPGVSGGGGGSPSALLPVAAGSAG